MLCKYEVMMQYCTPVIIITVFQKEFIFTFYQKWGTEELQEKTNISGRRKSEKPQWGTKSEWRAGIWVENKNRWLQRRKLFFQAEFQWCSKVYTGRCGGAWLWALGQKKINYKDSTLWNIWATFPIFSPPSLSISVHTMKQTMISSTEQSRHITGMGKPVWKSNTEQFEHENK